MPAGLRRRDLIRANRRRRWPELLPAIVAVVSAAIFVLVPNVENPSALASVLPRALEWVWMAVYALGGCALFWGVWQARRDYRRLGWILLATVALVDFYAVADVRGSGGALFLSFLLAYGLFGAALAIRSEAD